MVDGLPDGVIGVSAIGKVKADDYSTVLIPLIDAAVDQHGKVAMLIVLGPKFEGYSAGGAADDMRLGLSHFSSFRRLAVVTDEAWIRHASDVLMHLVPGKGKSFAHADLDDAKLWVAETD